MRKILTYGGSVDSSVKEDVRSVTWEWNTVSYVVNVEVRCRCRGLIGTSSRRFGSFAANRVHCLIQRPSKPQQTTALAKQ